MARLTLRAIPSTGRPRAPLGERVVIRADRCERGGVMSAMLATSDLDIESLDPARKAAAAAAFARMRQTLERPMQLLVRVRRLTATETPPMTGPHARLDTAMRQYWTDQVGDGDLHTRQVFVILSAPTPGALDSACAQTCDRLTALGVSAHRLEGEGLAAAMTDGLEYNQALTWSEFREHAVYGDCVVRRHALQRLPGHPVGPGWLAPLLSVQVEADIAIHLEPAPLGDALGRLNRRLRDFWSHRMLEIERGALGDVHVDIGLDSATALRDRLARNIGRPLHLSVIATARGTSVEEVSTRSDVLRLGFASALIGVEVTHFRHMAALVSTLPLGVNALRSGKLVDSTAAATCVPWIEAGCSDADGHRLGAATRSGLPVRVAPFDTARHSNANIAVFAASGHGKSFAIGTLVLEAAVAGVNSVIIDPEGEYRGLVTALGGRYLELAPGTDAAVNVFEGAADEPEETVAAVVDLVTGLCGDRLGDVERAVVDAAARAAMRRALAEDRTPLLEDCLATLDVEGRPVAMVVRRFCTGGLGALFNRPRRWQSIPVSARSRFATCPPSTFPLRP
jgi:hypothetical protein